MSRSLLLPAAWALASLGASLQVQDPAAPVPPAAERQASCRVCHPGSAASLGRGPHAKLRCLACHTGGLAHQEHANDRSVLAGRGAERCATCHEGRAFEAGRARAASHPTKAEARALAAVRRPRTLTELGAPQASPSGTAFSLEGTLRAGWRFVGVHGDRRSFDHDYGLDAGPRLSRARLRAARDEATLIEASLYGLEDREFSSRVATGNGLSKTFGGEGSFRRNLYVYDAEGDFHTLSNTREWTRAAGHYEDADGTTRIFFEFERLDLDGRTLASRIGNPNQSPLVPATGVPTDRSLADTTVRLGFESRLDTTVFGIDFGWNEARASDNLAFSRPSPKNPGFTESETSTSRNSWHGPELAAHVVLGDPDTTQAKISVHAESLDTRYAERGVLSAFDTSAFTQRTTGSGSGDRRVLAADARLAHKLEATTRITLEARHSDVRDRARLTLFDTVTRGTLVTTTQQDLDLVTRVRDSAVRVAVEHGFALGLDAELGWRYREQYLLFPDLEALDADFRAGTVRTQGPDLALTWRPDAAWTLRGRATFAATDSRTPTETQPEVGRMLSVRARRHLSGHDYADVFAKWRRGENDVSSTEQDFQSYGATLSIAPWDSARLLARGSWNQIRSETLTNFYFAPGLSPVPTLVRFRGDSFLFDVELDAGLAATLHSLTTLGLQVTDGSIDSRLVRFDQEVVHAAAEHVSLGVRLSLIGFDERRSGSSDDYDAVVGFVFAELSW